MVRTRSKQTGFSIVETLIIVVVIGVIAGAGWLLYQNRTKLTNKASNNNQTNNNQQTNTNPQPDAYANWKTYCDSVYHYCFKYPQDWSLSVTGKPAAYCETGQAWVTNTSRTVGVGYTNTDPHDVGLATYHPVKVETMPSANQALSIVGGYIVNDNQPRYQIVDSETLTTYPLVLGHESQFPNNGMFTDKGTGTQSCTGSFRASPFNTIANATDAQSWFDSTDAKTSLLILKSFYYQP